MKTQKPLVSIILSVYKTDRFLLSCLESLSRQNYESIEIIAVVDYLGDESLRILRKYKKTEKRLRIYHNIQRYGLATTLNKAVINAKGQYIAFMDSAGFAAPSRIAKQVSYLRDNLKVAAVGSQTVEMDSKNIKRDRSNFPLRHKEIYKALISAHSLRFETFMIDRTRVPKDALSFKKATKYPFLFIDVFMKITLYKEIANLPQALVYTREISESSEANNFEKRLAFVKLLTKSLFNYDYRPSFKSLFIPIVKQY